MSHEPKFEHDKYAKAKENKVYIIIGINTKKKKNHPLWKSIKYAPSNVIKAEQGKRGGC